MIPFIKNLLGEYGYEIVALPKADIRPLLLLCKEGEQLTSLDSDVELLFEEDTAAIPFPTTAVSDISGQNTLTFDFGSGIELLQNLFKALQVDSSELKMNIAANQGLEITCSYENVKEDKVSFLTLDNYISGAIPLEKEFKSTMEKLKKSELYIITAVLKSNRFSIKAGNATSNNADFTASLEKLASVNAKVNRVKDNVYSISTDGETDMVFAYKAVQILYEKAKWFEFWKPQEANFRIKNQKGMVLRGMESFPVRLLKTSNSISDI